MTAFPAAGGVQNAANTVPQQKAIFEAWLAATKQLPGAAAETELTIDAGVITPTGFQHRVDTESDAASDNLDQVAPDNLPDGAEVRLVAENPARVVTLRHLNGTGTPGTSGEMVLTNDENFALDHAGKWIRLRRKGSQWIEVVRSTVFGRRVGATADAASLRTLGDLQQATGSLTENTAPALTDLLPMTVGGNHRKVQLQNVLNRITALAALTTVAVDDEIHVYDLSAAVAKKISPVELLKVLSALTEDTTPDKANDFVLIYDVSAGTVKKVKPNNLAPVAIFSQAFVSSDQTITSGGSLTIAHGLGVIPQLWASYIVCQTAEHGYSIGDIVEINPQSNSNGSVSSRGALIVPDATNLNIRFGSDASAVAIAHKSTGASANITNGNWKARFKAWA